MSRAVCARTIVGMFAGTLGLSASALAFNDGYIDGIYQCVVTVNGQTSDAFMSLNGRKDGRTVYMVAAVTPNRDAYSGYGLGLVTGNRFVGNTSFNKRFEFTLGFADANVESDGYDQVTLRGTVGVVVSGVATNARVDCKSIW
ncbi:MAG: hypothetical protein OHK0048_01910 [Rhodoferax sp.]